MAPSDWPVLQAVLLHRSPVATLPPEINEPIPPWLSVQVKVATSLVDGGRTGVFSPMHLLLFQKPEQQ